jgi:hypothetical protein
MLDKKLYLFIYHILLMKKLSGVAIWLIIFLVVWGISIFQEYFGEHTYYFDMLKAWDNWLLLLWWVVSAAIPLGYNYFMDKKATTKWLIWSTIVGILFFAYTFIAVRDEFIWSAFIALPLNISLMIWSAWLMLGGMWSGGSMLYRKLYHHEADTLDRAVTALVLWFVAALLISWALVLSTLLYQIVAVACIIACGYLIWRETSFWKTLARNMSDLINHNLWFDTFAKSLTTILLGITIMYLYYGIMLAFIPYPTAWDANHAYMYIPKIWAEHHGYLWSSLSAQFSPSPWLTYIAVWFQFGYAFKSVGGWIQPDTWAVVMNFLSAVLVVMIMTWWLTRRVIRYMSLSDKPALYQTSWVVLLSWLTSGMGAFLVFVDNKSDFGILAITLCALILVFDWLPKLEGRDQEDKSIEDKVSTTLQTLWTLKTLQPVILSGLVAGVAIFSKPTSLFDFASVVVLFAGIVAGAWAMVGTGLVVIGVMALMKITTVPLYLSTSAGGICAILGLLLMVLGIFTSGKDKLKLWSRLIVWWAVMLGFLAIIKTPLMLWRQHSIWSEIGGVKWYVQGVLMGYNWAESEQQWIPEKGERLKAKSDESLQTLWTLKTLQPLLAQISSTPPSISCSIQSEWITQETLYQWTQKAVSEWAGEDLGRYIGYGGKTWDKPWRWFLLPTNTCIALDHDARVLCDARIAVSQWQFTDITDKLKGDALKIFDGAAKLKEQWLSASYIQKDLARQLNLYWQDKVLLKDNVNNSTVVSAPYRWIVPLNMTYNWSLQNLSSYYTDIGVVWLVLLMILLTATIWLLVYAPRRAIIPLTAIIGWLIWWVSGSSILWYGIGLIIWTMLSMIVIVDTWTDERLPAQGFAVAQISSSSRILIYYVFWLVWVIVTVQLLLNFIRIGSQGGWGIFVQYKTANARSNDIDEQLQPKNTINYGVSGKDIFNLQFPHYNKTINAIDANPQSKEAVLIAGTYMPYFLFNQYNIISDGFLTMMWEWFSDGNVCRSYLRLKDKNLSYLVIDPNIASVVMGEWNTTLRDRMFAKIDPATGKIIQQWAISMLAKLASAWRIELFNSNNIAAKYAFTLSDAEMSAAFGISGDDLTLTRTKVATARFRWDEGNVLLQKVLQIFAQRMSGPYGMWDLADIMGKDADIPKLTAIAQQVSNPSVISQIKDLNQDERYVLVNYLNIISLAKSNSQQYQQQLVQLLQQSIWWGSQLIVFKVK